jgi:hypothetical protein
MLCTAKTRFCLLARTFACQPFPLLSNQPRRRLLPLPCPNEGVSGWQAERSEAQPVRCTQGWGETQPSDTTRNPREPDQNPTYLAKTSVLRPHSRPQNPLSLYNTTPVFKVRFGRSVATGLLGRATAHGLAGGSPGHF